MHILEKIEKIEKIEKCVYSKNGFFRMSSSVEKHRKGDVFNREVRLEQVAGAALEEKDEKMNKIVRLTQIVQDDRVTWRHMTRLDQTLLALGQIV